MQFPRTLRKFLGENGNIVNHCSHSPPSLHCCYHHHALPDLFYLALFVEQVMHTASHARYVIYLQQTYQLTPLHWVCPPNGEKPLITLFKEKHTLDSLFSVQPLYDWSPPLKKLGSRRLLSCNEVSLQQPLSRLLRHFHTVGMIQRPTWREIIAFASQMHNCV